MKKDVTELKKMFLEILQNPSLAGSAARFTHESLLNDHPVNGEQKHLYDVPAVLQPNMLQPQPGTNHGHSVMFDNDNEDEIHHHEVVEESLNIMDKEKELIEKALKKHKGKRKDAAADLGISERTLYRKLKEYDINE